MTTNRNQNSLITDICNRPESPGGPHQVRNGHKWKRSHRKSRDLEPQYHWHLSFWLTSLKYTAGLDLVRPKGRRDFDIKFGVGRSKATFRRLGRRMYDDLIMGSPRRQRTVQGGFGSARSNGLSNFGSWYCLLHTNSHQLRVAIESSSSSRGGLMTSLEIGGKCCPALMWAFAKQLAKIWLILADGFCYRKD